MFVKIFITETEFAYINVQHIFMIQPSVQGRTTIFLNVSPSVPIESIETYDVILSKINNPQ